MSVIAGASVMVAGAGCGASQGRAHPLPARLFAYDAASGTQRWSVHTLPADVATISADAGELVLDGASDCAGSEAGIAVVRAADGQPMWMAHESLYAASNGPRSSSVPVLVVPGGTATGAPSAAVGPGAPTPGQTRGLALGSGAVVWTAPVAARYSVDEGTTTYVQTENSEVALSLTTGAVQWSAPVEAGPGTPVVDPPVVVVPEVHGMVNATQSVAGLDLATGRQRWQHTTGQGLVGLASSRDTVIVQELNTATLGGQPPTLTALNAGTGKLVWRRSLTDITNQPFTAPGDALPMATARGLLFLPGLDGRLFALDIATGHTRWTVGPDTPNGDAVTSLASDGSVLVVGTHHGIEVLDPARGKLRWQYAISDVTAVAAGSVVYAATVGVLAHCTSD